MKHIDIQKDAAFITNFQSAFDTEGPVSAWELFQMNYESDVTTMTTEFCGLRALEYLPHMEFLPHQIESAEQAIEKMNGRAILADEVGLGKTIEAGLILKEYMIRGLVIKALILVLASIFNEWVTELNEKYYIHDIYLR